VIQPVVDTQARHLVVLRNHGNYGLVKSMLRCESELPTQPSSGRYRFDRSHMGTAAYCRPGIIYKGHVHISAWYEEAEIPRQWKLLVSKNGWTNNALGLEWLKHFDMHTKASWVGAYRLLILDGHESHLNQDFKDYCLEHKILTLYMPPHSLHILQPLDVVCFSPLKHKYSQCVRDLARKRVFHINKEGFLPAFKDAFFNVFTEAICRKAFKASGLVPLNAQIMLDCLEVRLHTPPAPPPQETPWQSKTPSNTHEFGLQSKLVRESFTQLPVTVSPGHFTSHVVYPLTNQSTTLCIYPASGTHYRWNTHKHIHQYILPTHQLTVTAQTGFSQLIKGGELMLHQNALQAAWITELEEQLAVITKRKTRKRKRLQYGGTLEYGETADQVAASTALVADLPKKTCSSGAPEGALPTQRHCSKCGETGHNARTCQKDIDASSESEASTQYIFSDSSDDNNDD
jgi:hypothetical protein